MSFHSSRLKSLHIQLWYTGMATIFSVPIPIKTSHLGNEYPRAEHELADGRARTWLDRTCTCFLSVFADLTEKRWWLLSQEKTQKSPASAAGSEGSAKRGKKNGWENMAYIMVHGVVSMCIESH